MKTINVLETINVIEWVSAIIAAVGVLVFWLVGMHDMEISSKVLAISAFFAWLSILMKCIGYFYQKTHPF